MISIVESLDLCIFEEEYIVEKTTIRVINKYQDEIIEKIYSFLETGDISLIESYYDSELLLEYEYKDFNPDSEDPKARAKYGANFAANELSGSFRKHMERKSPGMLSKISDKIGKTKVGRAISRGFKRAVYGSEIGKKALNLKSEFQRNISNMHRERGKSFGKLGGALMMTSAITKPTDETRFKIGHRLINASGKEAAKSRNLDIKADKQDRKLHLLDKLKKPQTEKAGYKTPALSPA